MPEVENIKSENTKPVNKKPKTILGGAEYISFPDLDLPIVSAKVDTGAYSGAIAAKNLKITVNQDNQQIATFYFYPIASKKTIRKKLSIPVIGWANVASSNGKREYRPKVKLKIRLGKKLKTVETTLSNRDSLKYPVILGRKFLAGWSVVDTNKEFFQTQYSTQEINQIYQITKSKVKPKLKVAVLCYNPKLYSNKRLKEEAKKLGVSLNFLSIKDFYLVIQDNHLKIYYQNKEISQTYQAIIPRISGSIMHFGNIILDSFYKNEVFCLNSPESIKIANDKFQTFQYLSKKHISLPNTAISINTSFDEQILAAVGSAPVIIKLLNSSQGKGVVLSESKASAKSTLEALKNTKNDFLVQEYIPESKGKDIRILVIGGEVVASMERNSQNADEFRSNIHRGGTGKPIEITEEEKQIAIDASHLIGLEIAGIDIIRSKTGSKILEVNSSPGLEGIEKATGKNIAGAILKYLLKKLI